MTVVINIEGFEKMQGLLKGFTRDKAIYIWRLSLKKKKNNIRTDM